MLDYIKKLNYYNKNNVPDITTEDTSPNDCSGVSYTDDELKIMGVSPELSKNIRSIKTILGNSSDIVIRNMVLGHTNSKDAAVIYIENLIDSHQIDSDIIHPLMFDAYQSQLKSAESIIDQLNCGNLITGRKLLPCKNMKDLIKRILTGEACLLISGIDSAFLINVRGNEKRNITEAQNEPVIRGAKDAFVEALGVNISLIRTRMPSPNLSFEMLEIGNETHTKVCISYMRGICPASRISEVRSRLKRINIDGVLESGYLEEFIQDDPYSIFPQIRNTERPDVASASLLEGRVVIITDNTPIVLIVPGEFISLLQSPEDYYDRFNFSSIIRLLRFLALMISAFLPAFYIAVTNYHQEMIPTDLLISITNARTGVPIPTILEIVAMVLAIELLYDAGAHLPKNLGQTISIVGALIIGQAAVQAKLVSPLTVIIIALTAITTFCIPQYNLVLPIRISRFIFILLASVFGLFGIMMGILYTLLHLSSLRSFGVAYLAPLSPFNLDSAKDTVVRSPWWAFIRRPSYISSNSNRMKMGQRPHPPGE